jgi:hypothetical protein
MLFIHQLSIFSIGYLILSSMTRFQIVLLLIVSWLFVCLFQMLAPKMRNRRKLGFVSWGNCYDATIFGVIKFDATNLHEFCKESKSLCGTKLSPTIVCLKALSLSIHNDLNGRFLLLLVCD